jgi:hypothetical protein
MGIGSKVAGAGFLAVLAGLAGRVSGRFAIRCRLSLSLE